MQVPDLTAATAMYRDMLGAAVSEPQVQGRPGGSSQPASPRYRDMVGAAVSEPQVQGHAGGSS